jgi:hypothetical protein
MWCCQNDRGFVIFFSCFVAFRWSHGVSFSSLRESPSLRQYSLSACAVCNPLSSSLHVVLMVRVFMSMLLGVNAVMACQAIANIVKSSLGPVGLDKVRIFL